MRAAPTPLPLNACAYDSIQSLFYPPCVQPWTFQPLISPALTAHAS